MFHVALPLLLLSAAPKVVSPEWNAVNVKKEMAAFYADALADALRKQGLEVVTSQDIATLLGMERQKSLAGCAEASTSCMAELANALGADATLTVNLARFDDGGFHGIAKLLSSQSGQTLSSTTIDAKNERKLLEALQKAAPVLAAPLTHQPVAVKPAVKDPEPEAEPVAPPPEKVAVKGVELQRPPLTRFWWLFGVGGVAFAGAGAALLGLAVKQFESLNTASSYLEASKHADNGKWERNVGWVGVTLGGALLVTSIVLAAWPGTPVVPQATVTPTGASAGVGGVF